MCGIVGYIGEEKPASFGINLLKRLEYRGYDSAGLALLNEGEMITKKAIGKVKNLKESASGSPFIMHTRWATHGSVTEENTHPHSSCDGEIQVVHNGIVENYNLLKEKLVEEGHTFSSETDTEVIAHLIEKFSDEGLERAVQKSLRLVEGTYGLAVISSQEPDKIIVARRSSPIILGLGEGESFVASDIAALVDQTKRVIYLEDEEIAVLTPGGISVLDLDLNEKEKLVEEIDWKLEEAQKGGHPHFMLKEILEQPETVRKTLRGRVDWQRNKVRLGGLEEIQRELEGIDRLIITACGTSYFAGLVGEYLLEGLASLPVEVEYASELRYRDRPWGDREALLVISQSGETADSLAALRKAKESGLLTLGLVNVVGSSIAKETDAGIYLHAGPEIGVASTKAFVSQLISLVLLSLFFEGKIIKELRAIPEKIEDILERRSEIKELADLDEAFFVGRGISFPVALEGALKMKEVTYTQAQGYPSGEIKHGPLALIEDGFPVIVICPQDDVYEKTISNIEEIRARGGRIIAIATEGDERIKDLADEVFYIPQTDSALSPILSVIPLQLLAYYASVSKGNNPDKPRNLAKSVTVE